MKNSEDSGILKVLIVSTAEFGIAPHRLMRALQKCHIDARMLVRDKKSADGTVITVNASFRKKLLNVFRFFWERWVIWSHNGFSRKNLFAVSIANTGNDISHLSEVKQADIIHLHWINHGFLSLEDIRKLLDMGKPIVWTMHDMWAFTGVCHYVGNCLKYRQHCGCCPLLKSSRSKDLSYRVFDRKQQVFDKRITFVACSDWLALCARESYLLKNQDVISIPNPIDIDVFCLQSKLEAKRKFALSKNKKAILFGAAKLSDPRKGYSYFCRAMELFARKYPSLNKEIELVFFGNSDVCLPATIPYQVRKVGYLTGEADMAALYNAVDVFVIPSLEDNLPNTVMEAMACGVAVVGFATGGIPQMIDHMQNGYVAGYASCEDLMKGIYWVLYQADIKKLTENARQKIVSCFSEEVIVERFRELYNSLILK